MNVFKLNGIKVYNFSATNCLPEWASKSEKRRKKSSSTDTFRNIELIQSLEMPDSSTHITTTPDNRFLFTLGRYKPRVRCYELSNLSLKFDRCVDYLPYKMVTLGDDYSKFALLEDERWIDVHAAGGHYFKFRIPRQGVDISYCSFSCDLFIVSSRSSIYRMNLSEGRFKRSLVAPRLEDSTHGFTCSAYGREYGLLLGASSLGCVDGWDTRSPEHVFGLNVKEHAPLPEDLQNRKNISSISCIRYKDPLNVAIGTNEGMVYIYDLRQNRIPWHVRDTEFREPVKSIVFHDDKAMVILPYCCKIWSLENGKIFVGFNTGNSENNWMHHFTNSGLIMLATESPKILTYFIPLLGEAPFWCNYLDQLVVECEPDVTTMYDGYKFVTRQQLIDLGMSDLIGTQFLRAYMHGYFISAHLYDKVKKRLGIDLIPEQVRSSVSQPSISKAVLRAENIVREFDEAAVDDRFVKLTQSKKLEVKEMSKESDLIQIHQARLEKKRRRKVLRKERAARAQSMVDDKDEN